MDLDTLLVTTFLLLTITSSCCGSIDNNCTTYPSFTDYYRYATDYHCDLYTLPPIFYYDQVEMTVNVSESNITLIWHTGDGHVIDCDPIDEDYLCTNDNKTLKWRHATNNKIFYVNATNSCGGNATACFIVKPFCSCNAECRHIPNATNKSVEVLEYSNHTFEFTITGDTTIALQWCFVGSNNHSECCMCNDDPCQNKDWTAVSICSPSDCHQFTCLLTIHNMTMNYSNGTLISKAAVSDDDIRVVNHTHVSVTQDSNHHHKPLPTLVYGVAIGVGVGVVAIVIVICVVCMTKRSSRCSKSYSVYQDYETIPSSSNNVLQRNGSRELNDDFESTSDYDDDVMSCDLGNPDIQTPMIARNV